MDARLHLEPAPDNVRPRLPAAVVEGLAADWPLPGVAFNLQRFGALVQLRAMSAWVQHIRANPRNAPAVGVQQAYRNRRRIGVVLDEVQFAALQRFGQAA